MKLRELLKLVVDNEPLLIWFPEDGDYEWGWTDKKYLLTHNEEWLDFEVVRICGNRFTYFGNDRDAIEITIDEELNNGKQDNKICH